jgi:hypothetical protein
MFWKMLAVAVMGGFLLLNLKCGGHEPPPTVKGSDGAGVIRFAHWGKGEGTEMNPDGRYEIRQAGGQSSEELLFAFRDRLDEDGRRTEWYDSTSGKSNVLFSYNYYAVRPNELSRVRPATAKEWSEAAPLLHSEHEILSNKHKLSTQPDTQDDAAVFYGARKFPKSGQYWSRRAALVSPHQKWLAVFSYSSPEKPREQVEKNTLPGFLGGGTEPGNGELFLDVYNISSGEKILSHHTPYSGFGPSWVFSNALWLEDRFLVMPLDYSSLSCFLGTMPSK